MSAEHERRDYWGKEQQADDESAPLLYSRRAIYAFSFLFSALFGAALMALNLRELKKHEGVVPTISFSIAYLATALWLETLVESHFHIEVKGGILVSSVGGWLLQRYLWNKYIVRLMFFLPPLAVIVMLRETKRIAPSVPTHPSEVQATTTLQDQ